MTGQATSETIYTQVVKPLPERLKLATMILNDISPRAVVDYNEEWTDEDFRDFSAASWAYSTKKLEEKEQHACNPVM